MKKDRDDQRDQAPEIDYSTLAKEIAPDPSVEDQLIDRLRGMGHFGDPHYGVPKRRRGSFWARNQTWLRAAASVVLFLGGLVVGRLLTVLDPEPMVRSGYLLLVEESVASPDVGAGQRQNAALVASWMAMVSRDGIRISGERLSGHRRLVGPQPSGGLNEGASTPQVTGFFLVDSNDLEQVLKLAAAFPLLDERTHLAVHPVVSAGVPIER